MSGMPQEARRMYERFRKAPLTWHPTQAGRAPAITWADHLDADLGADADGSRFERISARMLSGHYYPADVIECYGLWIDENRAIREGDRMLQRAHTVVGIDLWAMVEIFAAEKTGDRCTLGYVTTKRHFGRGIWQATLARENGRLMLRVEGLSGPGSWLFWLGLPIARYLQRRARRRAVEEFEKL